MAELSPLRQGRVTASLVGAILGLSPHMTRRDAKEAFLGRSEFKGNIATEYGNANEAGAIIEYQWISKNVVKPSNFYMFDDWLGATPDGEIEEYKLLEVKCPYGLRNGGDFKSIDEQPHYYAQMQIQMFCADRVECDFFQWSPQGYKLETVLFSEEWIIENLPVLREFFDECMADKPLDFTVLLAEYDAISSFIEEYTDRKKAIIETLVSAHDGKDCIVNGRKLTLVQREGSVSYAKAIKDLLPDADLSGYKGKPTEYWKLS